MKTTLLAISLLFVSLCCVAQTEDIKNLIKGSKEDANYLVSGYVSPALTAFGYGLNHGWYNTAKVHKTLGFDITISVNAVKIPNSDLTYSVDNNQLKSLNHVGSDGKTPSTEAVPTLFGVDTAPKYNYKGAPDNTTAFDGPSGLDAKKNLPMMALPVPTFNLGIGLPKGFDLKLRYSPSITTGSDNTKGKFDMFGLGLMHNIGQYMGPVDKLPFDLAVFVGYTNLRYNQNFDASKGQEGKFKSSATTIEALISKKLSILTVYGAIGYNMSKTSFDALGTYTLSTTPITTTVTDPVSVSVSTSSPKITAGFRLKLAFFTLHADYSLQKYNMLSAGIGIAVR